MPQRTTALLIPCPWSGDENEEPPRLYWAWMWLYKHTRILRHRVGLHDYKFSYALQGRRCTWCGKTVDHSSR